MYTDGMVWAEMLKLKVFRPEDVVNSLNPPPGLMRKWVKQKVHSLISAQVRNGLLRRIVENPPVFATLHAEEEDIQRIMKSCQVCGKFFIPNRSDNLYCSPTCRMQVKQERTRRIRKARGVGTIKKKWTQEEIKRLEELVHRPAKPGEIRMVADELGRSIEAVRSKLKELKRSEGGEKHAQV